MTQSPSPEAFAIECTGIGKQYGNFTALDGVDLRIAQGEFFALLGPNGAGKTSLISILAGLARPNQGQARIMGYDVQKNYRAARRALGVVPQELVYDPFFSVRESLRLQSGYFGLRHNDAWIDEILEHLGLTSKANSNMRALSGGMKRRVMVAQALVHRPPVIILDEPTAGVDVELRQSLWAFIQQLNHQGHTILLTTHYLEEAETLCNRIAMMKQGKIIALEDKAKLIHQHDSPQIKLKLSHLPTWLANDAVAVPHENHTWLVRCEDYSHIATLLAKLTAAQITIQHMEVRPPDLEAIFVKIMHL